GGHAPQRAADRAQRHPADPVRHVANGHGEPQAGQDRGHEGRAEDRRRDVERPGDVGSVQAIGRLVELVEQRERAEGHDRREGHPAEVLAGPPADAHDATASGSTRLSATSDGTWISDPAAIRRSNASRARKRRPPRPPGKKVSTSSRPKLVENSCNAGAKYWMPRM